MKTVLITGAASGVGKAIALTLKNERLILIDRDEEALKDTAFLVNADYFVCDVSNEADINKVTSIIKDKYETIDVLINNAGLWIAGHMSEVNLHHYKEMNETAKIKDVLNTNLFGPIALIRSFAPFMIQQGFGQIINVNSQSGVKTESPYPIYNASKSGGTAFRKAIQDDLGQHNVRITDVCPGLIDTPFYKHAGSDLPKDVLQLGLSAQDVADVVKYVFDLPQNITIPSIEVMSMKSF